MRIIHSFWSKPFLHNIDNTTINHLKDDWINLELYFMSWVLSCCSFKKHYSNITLYTDTIGKEVLIDILNLPYSSYSTELNSIDKYNCNFWALGKLHTYNLQKEPFIHVDGDVFIWDKLPADITDQDVIAQNEELNDSLYREQFNEIIKNASYMPKEISEVYLSEAKIVASNTGIFGGNDIQFINEYSKLALHFIETNHNLGKLSGISLINHFYEQYFLWAYANYKCKNVTYLLGDVSNDFDETLKFHLVPKREKYIHVVGGAKKNALACEQIIMRLKIDFPSDYQQFKQNFPQVKKYLKNVKNSFFS